MDLEGQDAIADGADGCWRKARQGGLRCGATNDLLEQNSAQDTGQRQIIRSVFTKASEHALEDFGDLAGRQLELLGWPGWTNAPVHWADAAASGQPTGGIVNVAVEPPKPLLRKQRLAEDVGLLVGAGIDRLDAVFEGLDLATQGAGGLRLPGTQDSEAD